MGRLFFMQQGRVEDTRRYDALTPRRHRGKGLKRQNGIETKRKNNEKTSRYEVDIKNKRVYNKSVSKTEPNICQTYMKERSFL